MSHRFYQSLGVISAPRLYKPLWNIVDDFLWLKRTIDSNCWFSWFRPLSPLILNKLDYLSQVKKIGMFWPLMNWQSARNSNCSNNNSFQIELFRSRLCSQTLNRTVTVSFIYRLADETIFSLHAMESPFHPVSIFSRSWSLGSMAKVWQLTGTICAANWNQIACLTH